MNRIPGVHFRLLVKSRKSNRREWKNTRMEGKWAATDHILSSHVFFLHSFMLKFLAIGFLSQHAKILKQTRIPKAA
jgi:hypothetical protein